MFPTLKGAGEKLKENFWPWGPLKGNFNLGRGYKNIWKQEIMRKAHLGNSKSYTQSREYTLEYGKKINLEKYARTRS
jgi:hypothetical protein